MQTSQERSASQFAEGLVSVLPVPIVATDLSGRVVALSETARSMLGIANPAAGLRYDALPIPQWARKREMASPRLLERGPAEGVSPVRAPDGSIIGAVQVLDRDPEMSGEKLCAAMAHEIRNPLTGIQGFADLLRRELREDDSRRDLLAKIVSGVQTLNATVSSMLDFCRPRPPRMERVDLPALVKSAVELSGSSSHLNVSVSIPAECATLLCDRLQMLQALVNLVRNAAQATPAGGGLRVSARAVAGAVHLTVSDNGRGMDARTKANLFKPFASDKPGGTGIGLAIVKRIVQQHSGDIRVESEPGKGTSITLIIPAGEPPRMTITGLPGVTETLGSVARSAWD